MLFNGMINSIANFPMDYWTPIQSKESLLSKNNSMT